MAEPEAPKIEFPCDYPFKVIGSATDDFVQNVATIVCGFHPEFKASQIQTIDSRKGNYVSLRFSVVAESEAQVKDMFLQLKALSNVQMVL